MYNSLLGKYDIKLNSLNLSLNYHYSHFWHTSAKQIEDYLSDYDEFKYQPFKVQQLERNHYLQAVIAKNNKTSVIFLYLTHNIKRFSTNHISPYPLINGPITLSKQWSLLPAYLHLWANDHHVTVMYSMLIRYSNYLQSELDFDSNFFNKKSLNLGFFHCYQSNKDFVLILDFFSYNFYYKYDPYYTYRQTSLQIYNHIRLDKYYLDISLTGARLDFLQSVVSMQSSDIIGSQEPIYTYHQDWLFKSSVSIFYKNLSLSYNSHQRYNSRLQVFNTSDYSFVISLFYGDISGFKIYNYLATKVRTFQDISIN